ncbi:MAG: hypothetical protein ACYC48_03000 [Minisyncoccota bacterium]
MKDKSILIGLSVTAIVIGVLIFAYGGIASPQQQAATVASAATVVPFTPLAQGEQTSVTERVNYLITSPTQLSELWKTMHATGTPPVVDFSTQNVLAVFAGNESSSSIKVAKIEDSDARMVSIVIARPDGACASKTASSPYQLVAVAASSLPLAHEDVIATTSCQN